ncbi:PTS fructose transporter subunit IA [Streptococcus agalactiae LMG 14747]|uniref:PTS fructose transporter subunit IA n=2 Tax=Streptococcus TaxID=1301 RepID=V6Z2X5_STRAG|nr:hypothetical protein [Streptococcus acidominimus]ESV55242.1 PTS fructose transporter subunit IA [Streptococcus agalactiae LMG 14747]SNV46590.1 membrane protein [Streptococcus acidominimus]
MTNREMIKGCETEIADQKHMIDNLGRWFSLFFVISSIGVVLFSIFHQLNLWVMVLGLVLAIIGSLGMILFGYGIYRGKKNVSKVIEDFQLKLRQ